MKLIDLKEAFRDYDTDYEYDYDQGDQLKKGWYRGDPLINDTIIFTSNGISVEYNIHQDQVHSPTRYYQDSPPESESYAGEPLHIVIDKVIYTTAAFEMPDLDYQIDYRDLSKTSSMQEFYNMLLQYGDGLSDEEKDEYNTKVLPAFKKDPMFIKKLFASIQNKCNNIYKGEV